MQAHDLEHDAPVVRTCALRIVADGDGVQEFAALA